MIKSVLTRIWYTNYLKTHSFWLFNHKFLLSGFECFLRVFDIHLVFFAVWPYCLFFGQFQLI